MMNGVGCLSQAELVEVAPFVVGEEREAGAEPCPEGRDRDVSFGV